jgi:hypothetical protein
MNIKFVLYSLFIDGQLQFLNFILLIHCIVDN